MMQRDDETRAGGEHADTVYAGRTRYTRLEYEAVLANASIGIAFTRERRFFLCNPKFAQMFGWERDALIGQPGEVVYPSAENYRALGQIAIPALSAGRQLDIEWELRRKDGSNFLARVIAKAIDPRDTSQGTIWIAEDITERRDARKRIKRALEEQELILDNATVGIAFVRERVLRRANRHLAQMLGTSVEELTGKSTAILFASEAEWKEGSRRAYEGTAPGATHDAEVRFKRADGTTFLCRTVGRRVEAESGEQEWIWSFEDVTAEHAAREALARSHEDLERLVAERTAELQQANRNLAAEIAERAQAESLAQHLADHDPLTGLPNRRILEDRLTQAIALSQRNRKQTAVMFVDLDRFKQVNDSMGHAVGDALLRETAERLSGQLRVGDTICRIGGDEFVVVLPEVKRSADPANVAQKIIDNLSLPFLIDGQELSITPSLGISVYPDDGLDAESLIRNADAAMYHAKEAGRANYQFFTEQMNLAAGRRIALEADLRRALQQDELQVFYQPLAALATRQAVSREALLRWAHPARGLLDPVHFMSVAEDTGLIVRIGERVLRKACAWAMSLDESRRLPVSVNLSLRQFGDPRLLDTVSRVLAETGLPAALLGFEIGESTLMHQTDHTLARLGKLRDMGVSLCVDGFGTGRSSLKFLKRFPVDRIKIDRSFLAGVPGNADDCTVVTAIAGLARNLKLEVVAVGVESEDQLAFLARCGCDLVQGYAIGEPLDASRAAETIGIPRDIG